MDEHKSHDVKVLTWTSSWSKHLYTHRPDIVRLTKDAFGDLRDDLQRTQWLRAMGWFPGVIWFFGLMGSGIYVGILGYFIGSDTACLPDGVFSLHPETYNMWSSSGFFQITLGGGHLTFAQAKVIDIVWDIAVGRGGQFMLAYLSWTVFRKYLTVCMGARPITYQTFRTMFLQNEVSIPSTFGIIKSFLFQRRLQSKVAMAFIIMTMVFLLAFPSITSAMTGYDANVATYMPDYDGNFVPFINFLRLVYVIHDGQRINKTTDYLVTAGYGLADEPVLSSMYDPCRWYREDYLGGPPECSVLNLVSRYVWVHGLGGKKNESSEFNNTAPGAGFILDPPVLNITAYAVPLDHTLGGVIEPELQPPAWSWDGREYNLSYIQNSGTCQTIGDYKWGFSFLQLFVCIMLLFLWTLGIYIMWLRAHLTLWLQDRPSSQTSGEHKAVLELAAAMQHELDIKHVHVRGLLEKQLEDRVDHELKGGAICYAPAYPELRTYSFRKGLRRWFKRDKWWIATIVISSVLCSTLWMANFYFWVWSFGLWLGLAMAMCIGTTNGSRSLITLIWTSSAAIIMIIVASAAPLLTSVEGAPGIFIFALGQN